MSGDHGEGGAPGRRWIAVALACLAMLALPVALWLAVPVRHVAPAPPRPRASAAPVAIAPPPPPPAARPAALPRPAAAPSAPADGTIAGTVVDPDDRPVAGAFVECTGDQRFSRRTAPDGRFDLPPEATGCRATAHAPGFEPSDVVAMTAGAPSVLRLARAGGIAGVVVDEAGTPVPSYWLSVESFVAKDGESEVPPAGRMRRVDAPDGAFAIEGLYSGRYVLSAAADGTPPAQSPGVDVERGRTTSHVRIVLGRGATLTGVVTDAETRRPIAGARVALDVFSGVANAASHGKPPTTTDASGAFSLAGVPSGPFSVRVDAPGYRQKIASGLDARGGSSLRQDIAMTPAGDGGGATELVGIGAMLAPSPKGVVLVGVVSGGPAEKAGLQRGDRVVRIDGASAQDFTVSDAIQRLRGPEGSRVRVALARDGAGEIEVTMTRETIVR
jgi:hypothetical protein